MPHPSSNTTTITNATNQMISPQQDYVREKRFLVPTPPPCSTSPVELPPILDICDTAALDNRPPSPDSPKIKKFCIELPPAFLEPKPQMELSHQTGFFSLDLFKVFKKTNISLQIPIPRRSQKVLSRPITTNDTPMSPIMAAASASAAAAAAHRHPGSHVAKSLLKSISGKRASLHEDEDYQEDVTFTAPQQTSRPLNKKQATAAVDQSMFLTKNAHIKRPRNAWIHFRCHYGQALKSQDPTLRAEEISKRASRRWGKLSENEKKPWHGLAEQEKLAHREAFPEYRYCPRRANSTSSPPSPPPPTSASSSSLNINRPRSASEVNTPLHMHDYNNNARIQKKMKRISK